MSEVRVTIFGGNGFLGRYIVGRLAKTGAEIVIACRHPHEIAHLKPLGNIGQINALYCDINSKTGIKTALYKATHVINLVGILKESKKNSFFNVHENGARMIAESCKELGVKRLIHVSSLIATETPHSRYGQSKQAGEKAVRDAFPDSTILKPSVMYGEEDSFLTRFAAMAETFKTIPLVNKGQTKFQPVYVDDVAKAIVHCLFDEKSQGKTYELGGDEIYSFSEILQIMSHGIHRDPFIISLPKPIAKLGAVMTCFLKNPPLTLDQIKSLEDDSTVSDNALKFSDLEIQPKKMKTLIPEVLKCYIPQDYQE